MVTSGAAPLIVSAFRRVRRSTSTDAFQTGDAGRARVHLQSASIIRGGTPNMTIGRLTRIKRERVPTCTVARKRVPGRRGICSVGGGSASTCAERTPNKGTGHPIGDRSPMYVYSEVFDLKPTSGLSHDQSYLKNPVPEFPRAIYTFAERLTLEREKDSEKTAEPCSPSASGATNHPKPSLSSRRSDLSPFFLRRPLRGLRARLDLFANRSADDRC
jgi:hypothetical protein